jgi:hypothetical protein
MDFVTLCLVYRGNGVIHTGARNLLQGDEAMEEKNEMK